MDLVIINRPQVYPYRRPYRVVKRILDIVICILALPIVVPVVAVCAILIRLDSAGPVIFVQERIGKDGEPFKIYKFRTMYHNLDHSFHRAFMKAFVNGKIEDKPNSVSEANSQEQCDADVSEGEISDLKGAFRKIFLSAMARDDVKNEKVFKPFNSSQVTRVGRFLRKTSLDELPQILNVFKGEMSWVGPRPNVPWEVEEYRPWHHERLEVLPGITGLAQVKGRSSISFDRIVQYDIEYVQTQDLILDLKIIWQTFSTALWGNGAG